MRVTNSMMINSMMRNLTKNFNRMDKLNQQMYTNKKFTNPSDDPIGVSRSLRLNTEHSRMVQFQRNVDDAASWIETTELATNNIISVLQRARELNNQAVNATNSPEERTKIADEISQLREQLISIGNSTYAGSYIFSGFKTDKPLLKSDGTYDLDGGSLNANENIMFNVGFSDKIGVNFVGQRIFGYLDYTVKEQYEIVADDKFSGLTVDATSDEFIINYNNVDYTVNLNAKTYNPNDSQILADDINAKIDTDGTLSMIKGKVKAEVVDGRLKFVSARPISISQTTGGGATPVILSNSFKITSGTNGTLKYISNTDEGNLNEQISMGRYDNILKATADFGAITIAASGTLSINYAGNKYDITLGPESYGVNDGESFCLDLNNKIKDTEGLKNLLGHVEFKMDDGRLNIISDSPLTIDSTNIAGINLTAGDSAVKAANILESSILSLSSSNSLSTDVPNDKLIIEYNGQRKVISLLDTSAPIINDFDGSAGKTLNDFVNRLQDRINDPSTGLAGHVTVLNEGGRITLYSDKTTKMLYTGEGNAIANTAAPYTLNTPVGPIAANTDTLIFNYNGIDYDIKLDDGSSYTTLTGLQAAIQNKIDGNVALRGHVFVDANTAAGTLSFSSDEKLVLKDKTLGVAILGGTNNGQIVNSSLLDGMEIRAGKNSIKLEAKVDSGAQTQLIGVFDQLLKDLKTDNVEGISKGLKRLDMQIANISAVRAEIGVKSNRLELTGNRILDDTNNLKSLLSKNEEPDMAQVIMQLKMEENVYRASLSAGARIIQPSLVDFLR